LQYFHKYSLLNYRPSAASLHSADVTLRADQFLITFLTAVSLLETNGLQNCHVACGQQQSTICASEGFMTLLCLYFDPALQSFDNSFYWQQ
jgi:hypothetical protein